MTTTCQFNNHFFQQKELSELTESPPEGITVELADESNVYEWKVCMDGPEGSPYHVRRTTTQSLFPFEDPSHPSFLLKVQRDLS